MVPQREEAPLELLEVHGAYPEATGPHPAVGESTRAASLKGKLHVEEPHDAVEEDAEVLSSVAVDVDEDGISPF